MASPGIIPSRTYSAHCMNAGRACSVSMDGICSPSVKESHKQKASFRQNKVRSNPPPDTSTSQPCSHPCCDCMHVLGLPGQSHLNLSAMFPPCCDCMHVLGLSGQSTIMSPLVSQPQPSADKLDSLAGIH